MALKNWRRGELPVQALLLVWLLAVPSPAPSIFAQLLLPCAESSLNSIIGLKTDKKGPEVENARRLLANE